AVTAVVTGSNACKLDIESEQGTVSLQARLVVAADGAASTVRQLLGIDARCHDYEQTAVICNVTPSEPHRGRAFEWLTDSGPFAILPHVGNRCGLVWSVPTIQAQQYLDMDDAQFLHEAQKRFGNELGAFRKIGRRSTYPLKLVRAGQDTSGRVIIMGNAAHAIHPAGAQGFNLGLRDVAVLAELLAEKPGQDPGCEEILAAYSSWRKPDHDETVAWTDGLVRLFANPSKTAGLARTAGILAHALLPPLRRRLASKAMGYRGRTPKLALGQPLRNPG
ncbi:MAG: FAD-dependent monooxygenase, partial [Gammaproteobacteria bacterium]|nr:FAD-dependent monooxygenase [Gammaproteobacteria bacterium]